MSHQIFCNKFLLQFLPQHSNTSSSMQQKQSIIFNLYQLKSMQQKIAKYKYISSELINSSHLSLFNSVQDFIEFMQEQQNYLWDQYSNQLILTWEFGAINYKKIRTFCMKFEKEEMDQFLSMQWEIKILRKQIKYNQKMQDKQKQKQKSKYSAGCGKTQNRQKIAQKEMVSETQTERCIEKNIEWIIEKIKEKSIERPIQKPKQKHVQKHMPSHKEQHFEQKVQIQQQQKDEEESDCMIEEVRKVSPLQKKLKKEPIKSIATKKTQRRTEKKAIRQIGQPILLKDRLGVIQGKSKYIKKERISKRDYSQKNPKNKPIQKGKRRRRGRPPRIDTSQASSSNESSFCNSSKQQGQISVPNKQNEINSKKANQIHYHNVNKSVEPNLRGQPLQNRKTYYPIAQQKSRKYKGENLYEIEYVNGDTYKGEMKNNQYNGFGRYTTQNYFFQGEWKDCETDGPGYFEFRNANGTLTSIEKGIYKPGCKRFGKGEDTYENGQSYFGQYYNEKKSGFGIYYFANGDRYEGQWKDDMQHGKGIQYFTDGTRVQGQWYQDERHGQCIVYSKSQKKIQKWQRGDLISQKSEVILLQDN